MPDASVQATIMKTVKEVYADEWAAAKTSAQKQALAKKIVQKATESEKDLATRFVLLKLAKDAATQAYDSDTTFRSIDEMDKSFQIDALEMKAAVLARLASMAVSVEQHNALAEAAFPLVDAAVAKDDFTIAKQLADLALSEAKKAKDKAFVARAEGRAAEVDGLARECEAVKSALARLNVQSTDPEANLTIGKYKCFVKGDWAAGLPMLALGSDTTLKTLATKDIKGAASSDDQASLGDEWWAVADNQEGAAKKAIQGRAGYWYQKALPGLSGLTKDKVEKRLAVIGVAKPTEAANGESLTTVNLLSLLDKDRLNNGELVLGPVEKAEWFRFPYQPPEEYDFETTFTRSFEKGILQDFIVLLPIGDRFYQWVMRRKREGEVGVGFFAPTRPLGYKNGCRQYRLSNASSRCAFSFARKALPALSTARCS